jgi:alanine-glyoxylate transaminase / serine-glyoxylate transaminase / serine-pyruvate transaminase
MSLRGGREFLMIPGPTMVPDEVLSAMHRPAVDIYSGPLVDVTMSCLRDLRTVFRTTGDTYIYAANGHGAWESALTNTLSRGDRVVVLESGLFALGWAEMAKRLGIDVIILPGGWRRAADPDQLQAFLRNDREGRVKAVLLTQVDTASGVLNDIPAIRRAVDEAGHGALLMVDLIASLGAIPFEMDEWGVDVAVAASQKGLMMTPGLSFVAASPRAKQVHPKADLRTFYWDWSFRDGPEHYQKYCGTCPEHLMFGFRKALDLILSEGLDNVHQRHRLLAEATRRAVAEWAKGGAIDFNILQPDQRSDSVTVLAMDEAHATPLLDYCRDVCGVVLGIAIGPASGRGFRIGHMGHINAPTLLGTLGVIEMGLAALGIPHGSGGCSAAIAYLAEKTDRTSN